MSISENINLLTAFLAGLATFFAPCTFVTLPTFIAYLGLRSTGPDLKEKQPGYRSRVFLGALAYVGGFLLVFTLLGITATQIGTVFQQHKELLEKAGALLIIAFGVFILLGEKVRSLEFLYKNRKLELSSHRFNNTPVFPFIIGMTSAFAWTPCIGPLLGSILFLAGFSAQTVWQGGILLFVYGLGITLPFLLLSLFIDQAQGVIRKTRRVALFVHRLSAVVMILLGLILLFGLSDQIFASVFRLFVALGYRPA
jgi:cytochrome c-type biogenesis protein